jgi:hypothetical protein
MAKPARNPNHSTVSLRKNLHSIWRAVGVSPPVQYLASGGFTPTARRSMTVEIKLSWGILKWLKELLLVLLTQDFWRLLIAALLSGC